jgi:hypothetical protein
VHLLDEAITTQLTATGRPVRIIWRANEYEVSHVLAAWEAPGAVCLYRLRVAGPDGPAVAEVADRAGSWHLRRYWH